jgi:hypothetical protein
MGVYYYSSGIIFKSLLSWGYDFLEFFVEWCRKIPKIHVDIVGVLFKIIYVYCGNNFSAGIIISWVFFFVGGRLP